MNFISDTKILNIQNRQDICTIRYITTVIKIRTILFALLTLSARVDEDTKNLANNAYKKRSTKKVKEDLEQSKRLKNILQIALAPFYKEIAQNNRQHYTAVLNRSIELFAIDDNWDRISSKLESNSDEMDDLYTEKTDEESEYQSKALNYVQVILGISVLFDIFRNILPSDSPLLTPILQIISWAALIVLVFIIVILF